MLVGDDALKLQADKAGIDKADVSQMSTEELVGVIASKQNTATLLLKDGATDATVQRGRKRLDASKVRQQDKGMWRGCICATAHLHIAHSCLAIFTG